jgi:ferrous iron transport protein A
MADPCPTLFVSLVELARGARGLVQRVIGLESEDPVARRLLELGFDDGIEVELLHTGPFGGNPLAVRVGSATVALRRAEADRVKVIRLP